MRSIKYIVMACAAAALVAGCATYDDRDAQGRPQGEPGTYEGQRGSSIDGLNRGVNTNYFGPVHSGPQAARGPGTPSGNFDHGR